MLPRSLRVFPVFAAMAAMNGFGFAQLSVEWITNISSVPVLVRACFGKSVVSFRCCPDAFLENTCPELCQTLLCLKIPVSEGFARNEAFPGHELSFCILFVFLMLEVTCNEAEIIFTDPGPGGNLLSQNQENEWKSILSQAFGKKYANTKAAMFFIARGYGLLLRKRVCRVDVATVFFRYVQELRVFWV